MTQIPEGFSPVETVSPFIANNGPFYFKTIKPGQVFGLRVAQKHCNRGNRLHGGMVCTIADIAIGHNIGLLLWAEGRAQEASTEPNAQPTSGPPGAPMATVSMSTDFTGSASLGDWVEVEVDVHRLGGSLAFANAYLACNARRIARVSAVFKIIRSKAT